MERDVGISIEMLAVFVRFSLTTNPSLLEPAQAAGLLWGRKLRQEISDDIEPRVGARVRWSGWQGS
ncbi:hypothetical protein [Bradyrhizobium pachyrhizi]|uniref:hypothetical protein n=1 Tax=Bradyrhizobium pachyrhizi TaxID=280333 RepID=UPI003D35E80D